MDLTGRIAVVTGGASGIGAACADRLEAEGARPVRWDLTGADVVCDVRDPASIDHAMAWTVDNVGTPSIAVAAAGIATAGAFIDVPVEDFDRTLAVNLRGVFLTLQAVAREMVKAELDGSLLAIASVNGILADPHLVSYSTSKAGVYHLARVAAVELGRYGIRVNAIGPGPTETPMLQQSMSTPGYVESVEAATPLGRLGTPDLVADAAVNVLRSEWITGQAIMADGGSSLMTARGNWRASNAVARS
jgi:NAD(P)-dependent dehydrogenase (short-subunit alcohol dehydrogenase family)